MNAYESLKTARGSSRPTGRAYIQNIFSDCIELHGDRRFGDDAAIVGGIGYLGDLPVTYIAIEKGTELNSRMACNFGCPKPEGYRKSLRLMKQAEKFNRPVICFVDTLGAFCGADAEERGQGQAIAENIMEMMGLKVPVITVIIGEGGSGGALALASANKVYMLENAVYSVITPEGCASIIWKDSSKVEQAAECLHITSNDMKEMKVADRIIKEDFNHFQRMCADLKDCLIEDIENMTLIPGNSLPDDRYNRFRKFGVYNEE